MSGRLHVVGAGVAGLATALAAARSGRSVLLHEAAPQAGGRCRAVPDGMGGSHDNGTHVLLGANPKALAFLAAIGARARWVEPEPAGLPVLDLATGKLATVALSPWSWLRAAARPPGLSLHDLPGLLRLAFPLRDCPVASLARGSLARSLIEPLTLAALNTPLEEASARRLAPVLRRLLLPGRGRLLVARHGLGPDLVEPALRALAGLGVPVACGRRLKGLLIAHGRATHLLFADGEVPLTDDDGVVLALPPPALAKVMPGLGLPERFEAIVNLHFDHAHAGRLRFVGLLGALAQWVLFRPGRISVTISAARDAAQAEPEALAERVWREVGEAAAALRIPLDTAVPPACRVIKERRATMHQGVGQERLPARRPLANLTLAGDWLTPLPATIEAAVASGLAAAGAGFGPRRGGGPFSAGAAAGLS